MNTKHTPGPWHCYQPKDSPRQITDGEMRICTMTNRSQEIANARLIAAAPELLEALKYIEGRLPERDTKSIGCARAAIDKALGNRKSAIRNPQS